MKPSVADIFHMATDIIRAVKRFLVYIQNNKCTNLDKVGVNAIYTSTVFGEFSSSINRKARDR